MTPPQQPSDERSASPDRSVRIMRFDAPHVRPRLPLHPALRPQRDRPDDNDGQSFR